MTAAAGALVPSPADMPGAKPVELPNVECGKGTGLYRCCRKAGHGGNCTPTRRDDIDLGEDFSQLAPSGDDELLAVHAVVNAAVEEMARKTVTPLDMVRPPRLQLGSPHAVADLLDVGAGALRRSVAKNLTAAERRHFRAIAESIASRVAADLTSSSPPGPEPT